MRTYSKTLHDLAGEVAKFQWPDISLRRYSSHGFKDHIELSCDKRFYIEAYSLAIQYVEDIFFFFIKQGDKLKQTDVSKVIAILHSTNLISTQLYDEFIALYADRNKLAHNILRKNEQANRQRIAKTPPNAHKTKLLLLISLAEKEFLALAMKFPDKFIRVKNEPERNKERLLIAARIISDSVEKTIIIPSKLNEDEKAEYHKNLFKQEFIKKFENFYLGLYPLPDKTT